MAAFFLTGLENGQKDGKDERLQQGFYKAFKVRLLLFLEDFMETLRIKNSLINMKPINIIILIKFLQCLCF